MRVTKSKPAKRVSKEFAVFSKEVKSYANHPMIVKKAKEAEELLKKHGLPK